MLETPFPYTGAGPTATPDGSRDPTAGDAALRTLLRSLIEQAAGGEPPLPSDDNVILDLEADGVRCVLTLRESGDRELVRLSPREQQVVQMVAAGYPNKRIAWELGISSWTVSTHLRRIFAKLGVNSRAAAVKRGFEEGLITSSASSRSR